MSLKSVDIGINERKTSNNDGSNSALIENGTRKLIFSLLGGDFDSIITDKNVYLSTALYLVYWYHRTKNNPQKHDRMYKNMLAYFGEDYKNQIGILIQSEELKKVATEHVENGVLIHPTVDLFIEREVGGNKEILVGVRDIFPKGETLIGGLIQDSDYENSLGIEAFAFAALRVAGEKILSGDKIEYGVFEDANTLYYFVKNKNSNTTVKLFYNSFSSSYRYKDDVKKMVEPSDPRHIVDTKGYHLEIEGTDIKTSLKWIPVKQVIDLEKEKGGLVFGHHRELVSHMMKVKTPSLSEGISHHTFIRSMVQNPLNTYKTIKERFENNNHNPETSFPELLPIVSKMISDLYSEEINQICSEQSFALAQRHLVDNDLKHCNSDPLNPCPYYSTLLSIMKALEFFDIIERIKKGFYQNWKTDAFNPQNPKNQTYAYFFRTKYKNHMDQLLALFPDEIIIPTYEHISATDLLKVRGIPLRFVGLSNTFLYVDEFWQSPIEFFLHDMDHSLRMALEDKKICETSGKTREQYIEESLDFTKNRVLPMIQIEKEDSEEEKELKKLKKVIFFEICHEDSRPLTKEVIINGILTEEGKDIHREYIDIVPETKFYKRNHSIEAQGGVSPLAFVLHKLQHGFFDDVDNQISQIVSPKYRNAEFIAKAAYEILKDLSVTGEDFLGIPRDDAGNISETWLLQRTCSKSVRKTHHTEYRDPAIQIFGDGTKI